MTKIFGKRITVAEGMRLRVSRHFSYSTFAVRGRHDNKLHLGNYICEWFPGTGFFARNSESHSYNRFVGECRKKLKQSFGTLLLKKEPNFDKEYARVAAVIDKCGDGRKREILASYQSVLTLAKEEELLQRIVRAIKDKMGDHSDKRYVSVLMHYKSSIAGLQHDASAAQIDYSREMSEERVAAWRQVVDAFHLMVESRRVWSVYSVDDTPAYEQVFFDMGIFDYIQVPGDTPVMRDHRGVHYYLLPDGIVEARSTIDFSFTPYSGLSMQFHVVDISTLAVRPQFNAHRHKKKHHHANTDALSTLYGMSRAQVVGELVIPELGAHFFVNHTGPVEDFVRAMEKYNSEM